MTKAGLEALIKSEITSQGNQVSVGNIAGVFGAIVDLLFAMAPEYSKTATYLKDAKVIYDGKVYKAKVAINVAESWTPAHWEEATIA